MAEQESLLDRVTSPGISEETFDELALLDEEYDKIELEQLRQSIVTLRPFFAKRETFINNPQVKSDFWVRVLSNVPEDMDQFIQASDAAVLSSTLKSITVERFELDANGRGEPRSVRFIFEFHTDDDANPFFENEKIVKDFYWRKQLHVSSNGKKSLWEGLVSEPIRIKWKEEMDITRGVLDAICNLYDAEKRVGGDRKKLPEYEKLMETWEAAEAVEAEIDEPVSDNMLGQHTAGPTFFLFFGFRGGDATAEQNIEAIKEEESLTEKKKQGDFNSHEWRNFPREYFDFEVFPEGEMVASTLASDVWCNALKYYRQSFVNDFSEDEEGEDEDGDDDDEASEGDDSDQEPPLKKTKV